MKSLCSAMMLAMVVGSGLNPSAADAAPITIPTDSELILNFDLTGQTPPPPYELVTFLFTFGNSGSQSVSVTYYDQLDGEGTSFSGGSYVGGSIFQFHFGGSIFSYLLDGLFSVGFRASEPPPPPFVVNPLTLVSATTFGTTGGVSTPSVSGTQAEVTPVPEPASLLLLGGGIAALAARVRRQRKQQAR